MPESNRALNARSDFPIFRCLTMIIVALCVVFSYIAGNMKFNGHNVETCFNAKHISK